MKWLIALPADLLRAFVALVAFGCAAAGALAWGGIFTQTLHILANLALLGVTGSLLSGLAWLTLPPPRQPLSGGPLALIGLVLWGALMVPDLADRLLDRGSAAMPTEQTFKVVQFNVWKDDWSHDDVKFDWIRKQDPDAVLMEEVGPASNALVVRLMAYYPYRTSCEIMPFSCSATILSKKKPIAAGFWHDADQPSAAWAKFSDPTGDYVLVASHINWPLPDGRQPKLLASLARDLASLKSNSVILTGDFNATPWSFPLRKFDRDSGLVRHTHFLPTWPAGQVSTQKIPTPFAVLPIDHVYASASWRLVSAGRGPNLGSDHYPVVVVLARDRSRPKTERAPSGKP